MAFPEIEWDGLKEKPGRDRGEGVLSSREQCSVGQRDRDIENELSGGGHQDEGDRKLRRGFRWKRICLEEAAEGRGQELELW